MSRKRILSKALGITGASLAGIALGVGANAALAAAASAPRVVDEYRSVSADADYDLKILSESMTFEDSLPEELPISEIAGGLDGDSARLLEVGEESKSYALKNDVGELCIVVFIPGEDWISGTACTDPETFAKKGLGLIVEAPLEGISEEKYLVPDAMREKVVESRHVALSDTGNLISIESSITSSEKLELPVEVLR
ncbi:hypothetical protein [Microbacterium marinilacus]|uniref:Uncharacterized protein n=1 Tax=Microbacterium marinilacus TaxID=415209 RepID=A0ABP7BRH0_9MICO|nr:hypothetical protein [Microbacterium marinilacus]MBY0689265.1 hypothetical protein [Microbacterium marinilacus]